MDHVCSYWQLAGIYSLSDIEKIKNKLAASFHVFSIITFCPVKKQLMNTKDKIIMDFVDAINNADIDGILNLMTTH